MADLGYLFLALFALTLVGTYIAVRRGLAPTLYVAGAATILSIILIILYSLTVEDNTTAQALFAGVAGGVVFIGITAALASFFRANQPPADLELASYSAQEQKPHERGNDLSDPS